MTQAKTEKAEVEETTEVVLKEKPKRETIEVIRTKRNPLTIKADKVWPNIFTIHREKGFPPSGLSGKYTSYATAEKAIIRYLG